MNVSSGDIAFSNATASQLPISVLTKPTNALAIQLEPGLPYMYLPKAICDLLATQLPITYDSGLNLYLWNTSSANHIQRLLNSPHYLSFNFNNNAVTIAVPLILLNLTLTAPIVSNPTPYFPCSPYHPPDGQTYILGRAFLQSAFLAQNWQSETLWLAQAPGPSLPPVNVKIILPGDETIGPMENPPTWEQTWKGVLTPLPKSGNGESGDSGSGSGSSGDGGKRGLSTGVKAGIGVVVVGLVIVAAVGILIWRKKRIATRKVGGGGHTSRGTEINGNARYELRGDVGFEKPAYVAPGSTQVLTSKNIHVVPQSAPAELEGNRS
jgi:LPXTG-motif cell wall-anchored protein